MNNQWEQMDLDRNVRFGEDDTMASEARVIKTNYARAKEVHIDRTCLCGGTKQFRVSVGAFKCVMCGSLETVAGVIL